jgi:hypothetical protein
MADDLDDLACWRSDEGFHEEGERALRLPCLQDKALTALMNMRKARSRAAFHRIMAFAAR